MSLAATVGIEVPIHGLLLGIDGARTYFVKRFDRAGWGKVPTEDFAQLTGESRDTKYDSSTERIIGVIDEFCSFPAIERIQLFRRLLFAFLTGNEDMHLKNWSVITREDRVELTPAYDLLNSTIVLRRAEEELALTLRGKKSNLRLKDFWEYLAVERLELLPRIIDEVRIQFRDESAKWLERIENSFLSTEMKARYTILLSERRQRLGLVSQHELEEKKESPRSH
jgi:serine/threonine-protein kinase HipA